MLSFETGNNTKVTDNTYANTYGHLFFSYRQGTKMRMNRKLANLYVVRSGNTTYYKIGHTSMPVEKRIMGLQVANPLPITCTVQYQGDTIDNIIRYENIFYTHFIKKHVSGEWFNLTKKDIKYIEECLRGNINDYPHIMNQHSPIGIRIGKLRNKELYPSIDGRMSKRYI